MILLVTGLNVESNEGLIRRSSSAQDKPSKGRLRRRTVFVGANTTQGLGQCCLLCRLFFVQLSLVIQILKEGLLPKDGFGGGYSSESLLLRRGLYWSSSMEYGSLLLRVLVGEPSSENLLIWRVGLGPSSQGLLPRIGFVGSPSTYYLFPRVDFGGDSSSKDRPRRILYGGAASEGLLPWRLFFAGSTSEGDCLVGSSSEGLVLDVFFYVVSSFSYRMLEFVFEI